jgi:hypothetical protein
MNRNSQLVSGSVQEVCTTKAKAKTNALMYFVVRYSSTFLYVEAFRILPSFDVLKFQIILDKTVPQQLRCKAKIKHQTAPEYLRE